MSGDGSLGYWYHETSHYYSHLRNNDDEITKEEGPEVSLVDEILGHRSLETSHSSSSNHGGRGHRYFDTSHSSSCNIGGYDSSDVVRDGSRSQETSHCSSQNWRTIVDVEGRGGYRSQTSHSSYNKPGVRGILLTLTVSSRRGEKETKNIHEKEKGDISSNDDDGQRRYRSRGDGESRGGIRVEDGRCGYRSKDTFHLGETVGGGGIFGYRYQTSHYSSHNPGENGILLSIPEFERGDSKGDDERRGSRSQ